jgi:hypothetical protein
MKDRRTDNSYKKETGISNEKGKLSNTADNEELLSQTDGRHIQQRNRHII